MDAPLAMTFVVAILTQEVASGNHDVFVDRLIQDAIDASGMQLVEQQLSVNMGHDFDIQRNPACNLLHVHLKAPRSQISTQHEVDNFHSTQPRQTITTTIAAGRTKPPRPTNKFIMYRKLQHKKFKDLNPDLSCIQISKLVAEAWKNLDASEQAYWDEQYRLELINHDRKYPGYRYQPRKPGQKKKRQSRKAMRAAATADASTTTAVFEAEMINFNSPTNSSTTTSHPISTAEDVFQDVSFANINKTYNTLTMTHEPNPITEDGTIGDSQLGEIFPVMEFLEPMSAEFLHGAEMFRQQRLEAEFGSPLTTDLDTEAALGFRDGADKDATLLNFWDPVF